MASSSSFFFRKMEAIQPPKDWRELPEVPLADEFMSNVPPTLPLNDFEARPQLRDQYFETQYRLHRYEATETLRRAIQTIRTAANYQPPLAVREENTANKLEGVNVYAGVRVTGYVFGSDAAGQRLVIPNAPVRDDNEIDDASDEKELFCPGTLVVLSNDLFKTTCYVATVADNEGLRDVPRSIDIYWARSDYIVTDPLLDLVMLEPTTGYFESLSCLLGPYLFSPGPHYVRDVSYLKETPKGSPVIPKTATSLDRSQHDAFSEATTREISITQGPPGTGKTFTSNIILQSLIETQRQCHEAHIHPGPRTPIIVAAQTNHALDQLLKKYVDSPGSRKVARLGGRSSHEDIGKLTIRHLQRARAPAGYQPQSVGKLRSTSEQIVTRLREALIVAEETIDAKELWEHNLLSDDQYSSITDDDWESNDGGNGGDLANWLGRTRAESSHAGPDFENSNLEPRWRGSRTQFIPSPIPSDSLAGVSSREIAIYLLANTRNLYDIRLGDRQIIYDYLRGSLHAIKHPAVADLIKTYNETRAAMQSAKFTNQMSFIHADEIEVIGCTVTGLLKYQQLISALSPQILLMEEAAEIREGATVASLLPSFEHLVLLGDHQQLQPHVDMIELASDPFRLNISMFERLIKLGIPHKTLLEQRRMIPCLREVHGWPEDPGFSDGTSVRNFTEAQMIVLFVQYLVSHRNLAPERITMLTYYRGQVDLLNRELAANHELASYETEWSVRTVDGFQGEENDIIILSLVRGPNGKAGFLTQENRVIVGLSRARFGLYIFGHKDILIKSPRGRQTWSKVVRQLKESQGQALPLCPGPETDKVVQVSHPDQMKRILRDLRQRKPRHGRSSSLSDEAKTETHPEKYPSHTAESSPSKSQITRSKPRDAGSRKEEQEPKEKVLSWTANLPSLPPRHLHTAEPPNPDLELVSLEDSKTIPASDQISSWDMEPLQPTSRPAEKEWLIEFSEEE
ncbi:hypothetical protein ED733_001882 [Metarhizium rileyi]|uniref:Helicase required for RNAi-mediated heterochromatin assembly 1 n=1 Tax=Metarhizium rileyi (strain RCEF 4871) TaxID=1649241 RepID=A0A5C6FZX2_METRR|nr:hypothetical protein ED733_001882 [Metarhizium rileyi]